MNKSRRLLKIWEQQNVSAQLANFVAHDQKGRNTYMKNYVSKFPGNWEQARDAYIRDTGADPNDLFGDSKIQPQARQLIADNVETITKNKQDTHNAWLLIQHMDNDVEFQKWFLNYLDTSSENYKYLYDRIQVNTGGQQRYNTQNV